MLSVYDPSELDWITLNFFNLSNSEAFLNFALLLKLFHKIIILGTFHQKGELDGGLHHSNRRSKIICHFRILSARKSSGSASQIQVQPDQIGLFLKRVLVITLLSNVTQIFCIVFGYLENHHFLGKSYRCFYLGKFWKNKSTFYCVTSMKFMELNFS